ncbi:MAG: hypothetical protein F6K58_22445 [Symploca sp. SIO2E9]|nr:hypothetical protein [Symploca sp. SIO2E9]
MKKQKCCVFEVLMDIASLISYAKTAQGIYNFFAKDSITEALESIGGVHLDAAKNTINKINFASNPMEAVNRTLGHLEDTQAAYMRILKSNTILVRNWYKHKKIQIEYINVCCLIAMCHKFLGDGDQVINLILNDAQNVLDGKHITSIQKALWNAPGSSINPVPIVNFISDRVTATITGKRIIPDSEVIKNFQAFSRTIRRSYITKSQIQLLIDQG